MKKCLFLMIIIVLLLPVFNSCDFLEWLFDIEEETKSETGNFWAQDLTENKHYRLNASLLAQGEYCNVWAEDGSGVTSARAKIIADEYDNNIHMQMINAFCPGFDGKNLMQWADYYGDGDGKLCILLLDIQDGATSLNGGYFAGYFWSGDFFNRPGSNGRDMIYIDTNPGLRHMETVYDTLAHEMQHLMNFVTDLLYRSEKNAEDQFTSIDYMDTWINEGLSAAAEYIYNGDHGPDNGHSSWSYFTQGKGSTPKGNNFYLWNNYDSDVLDDYATVCLFFQWLRLQAGGNAIFKDITKSENSDYKAVVDASRSYISGYSSVNWETLFGDWHKANYLNNETGIHGYKNDPVLKQVKAPFLSESAETILLNQGEAVYSYVGSSAYTVPFVSSGSNIRYSGLGDNKSIYTSGNSFTNGALLTYNINTVIYNDKFDQININEPGTVTGNSPPATAGIKPAASFSAFEDNRIYPIRIEEVLRRNGYRGNNAKGNNFIFNNASLNQMETLNE